MSTRPFIMLRRSRPLVTLSCIAIASACEQRVDADPASDPIGAGVPSAIDSVAVLRIGKAEGSEADILNRVIDPFLLADGRIVIPVAGDPAVRIYSADGRMERVLGSRGEGPGELLSIDQVWAVADTIEVFDSRLRRLTRYTDAGVVQTTRVDFDLDERFHDGWISSGLTNPERVDTNRPPGSVKTDTVAFHRVRPSLEVAGELTRLPGGRRYVTRAQRAQPEPLSPEVSFGVLGDLLLVGNTLDPVLRGVDSTGATRLEIALDLPPPLDAVDAHERVLAARAERGSTSAGPPMDFSDAPVTERLSVHWGFLVDTEGLIWVLVYDPLEHAHALGGWRGPGPGGEWFVFDRTGARIAQLTLPPLLYPTQITRDKIVGIERDDLGVESVVVYNLSRQP